MSTKDLFSGHSKVYATFRPTYPEELYQFIFKHVKYKGIAWDCATGNGQVAQYLSQHFQKVFATDISEQQLAHAFKADNIFYSVGSAEKSNFPDGQFDIITVAQALHWIDTGQFYAEVKRTAKPEAIIAVWGYSFLTVEPQIDEILLNFYHNIVGQYWDDARRLVENEYRSVPFPFLQIEAPRFHIRVGWSLDHLTGYLTSWSATQKYIQANQHDPVPQVIDTLRRHWKPDEIKNAAFPLFLKLGKVQG